MVKHAETIRLLLLTNCLSVFNHFVGLVLKGLLVIIPEQILTYLNSILKTPEWHHFSNIKVYNFEQHSHIFYPAGIYLFKFKNRNTRIKYEICSKVIRRTHVRCHWPRSGVLSLTLNRFFALSFVDLDQVNVGCVVSLMFTLDRLLFPGCYDDNRVFDCVAALSLNNNLIKTSCQSIV